MTFNAPNAIRFSATDALPFMASVGKFSPPDLQDMFGLSAQQSRAVIHRLIKKDYIHAVARGGGAIHSVYAIGPRPVPVTRWKPEKDMTRFLVSMTQANRA